MISRFLDLKLITRLLSVAVVFWLAIAGAEAGTIMLAWNPSTGQNVNDYIVHYGTNRVLYSNTINVGNQTTATLSLLPGRYYCAVTAVANNGMQSLPSAQLSFVVPPEQVFVFNLANGQFINNTGPVTLQAATFPAGVTLVQFYLGNTELGEVTSASQSVLWNPPGAGDYALTVKSYDAAGDVSTSNLEMHVVQPSIQVVGWSAGKVFQLRVIGAPGAMQWVYVSPDLHNWTLLTAQVNASGVMTISDAQAATQPQRFYRVVSAQQSGGNIQ